VRAACTPRYGVRACAGILKDALRKKWKSYPPLRDGCRGMAVGLVEPAGGGYNDAADLQEGRKRAGRRKGTEMSSRKGLDRAFAKAELYTALHAKITGYQKKYMKAVRECWKRPIDRAGDFETLETFGLGMAEIDRTGQAQFSFSEDLHDLKHRVEDGE